MWSIGRNLLAGAFPMGWCAELAVPGAFGRLIQTDAPNVEPLAGAVVVIASHHISVGKTVAVTVAWLTGICLDRVEGHESVRWGRRGLRRLLLHVLLQVGKTHERVEPHEAAPKCK